jgi:hypothetical protein
MDIQDSIDFDARWEAAHEYTVFVGGTEVIDYYTSERHAEKIAEVWRQAGHDDVKVVNVWTIEENS